MDEKSYGVKADGIQSNRLNSRNVGYQRLNLSVTKVVVPLDSVWHPW
jgi:hypothetical protein